MLLSSLAVFLIVFPYLTCVFALAKLWGKIQWHWAWVLAPTWAPAAILILAAILKEF